MNKQQEELLSKEFERQLKEHFTRGLRIGMKTHAPDEK